VYYIYVVKVDRDVIKLDRDIAHVAICFKCIFQMFHLYQIMLQEFHLNVAKVDLNVTYTSMLQAYVSCVS
jgi:hypothetical protein